MTTPIQTSASVPKPASVAETLRQARSRIDTPDKWTKGAYASTRKRESELHEVKVTSPDARYFCALGALKLIDGPFEEAAIQVLADAIDPVWLAKYGHPTKVIYNFNDAPQRRHREVLAAFDKAIAQAEAQHP